MQDDLVERVTVELIAMRLASYDDQARAIIPLVLEEAAVRVERGPFVGPDAVAHAIQHAAAIRAIGAKP
jgi:hypothetical protein